MLKVFSCLIAIVLLILTIWPIKNIYKIVSNLFTVKNNRRRVIRKRVVQLIVWVAGLGILLSIAVCLIKSLDEWSKWLRKEREDVRQTALEESYLSAVQKIPFHNINRNEDQTVWERLLYERMLYNNYQNWEEEGEFDRLWCCYRKYYVEAQEFPYISIDELVEQVTLFYGTDILPENQRTIYEIEKATPILEQRMTADILIFQNEFWLRVSTCNAYSSDEVIYQTGRAADDVFKMLAKDSYSYKEMLFYGGMAVSFYLASTQHYTGGIDLALVYYRIAEIYLYFYKYHIFPNDVDSSYYIHVLLSAEAFLALAEREYRKANKEGDIHEKLPYFGSYYAEILYKFIAVYDSKDKSVISLCSIYAEQYLESPFSAGDVKIRTRESCEDILTKLEFYR